MLLVMLGLLVAAIVAWSISSPKAAARRDEYWAENSERWVTSGISEVAAAQRQRLAAALLELRTTARLLPSTDPLHTESIQFIADSTPIVLRALYYPI